MSTCAKCKSTTKRDGLIGCEGHCDKWFHHSCINFSEADFKLLDKNKNLFYLCDTCKQHCEIVKKSVIENFSSNVNSMSTMLSDLSKKIDNLISHGISEIVEKQIKKLGDDVSQTISNSKEIGVSYAKIAKSTPSVILQPKDDKQNISVTKSDVLQAVDPLKSGVSVSSVRPGRNGSLIIKCDNQDDINKISTLTNDHLSDKYSIRELPSLNPRLRVVGITGEDILKNELLADYILSQNRGLFSSDSVCKVIDHTPLRNQASKRTTVYQATIQVDKLAYRRILDCGHLVVGFDSCAIYDAVEIKRCFNCSGYHHLSKSCTQKQPTCPKCAGAHEVKHCDSQSLKCVNCHSLKTRQNKPDVCTNHAVWDLKNCTAYRSALLDFKRNVLCLE